MKRRQFIGLGALTLFGLTRGKLPQAPVIPAAEALPMVPLTYPTMTWVDGGTLELGLVRDSLLNATNNYEIFAETFEGLSPDPSKLRMVTTA